MTKPLLVVDDSRFDRQMLVKALSIKASYTLLEAESGQQCIDIISTQPVGLVLLDILMPGTVGSEVLRQIRAMFNPIQLPVIMVTAKSETKDVIDCLTAGANDYVTKPVNFEVAVSRISTQLRLSELSEEMAKLKQIAALDAMITTYNHEINNPLSIALATAEAPDLNIPQTREKLHNSLWRIADIVRKIKSAADQKELEFQNYAAKSKMIRVR